MKLASILLCSSLLLLVVVECKPVKRSDVPALPAFEAFDKDKGLKVGTKYTVTLFEGGSGDDEDLMPKGLESATAEEVLAMFGLTMSDLNPVTNSEPTSSEPPSSEPTSSEPTKQF